MKNFCIIINILAKENPLIQPYIVDKTHGEEERKKPGERKEWGSKNSVSTNMAEC